MSSLGSWFSGIRASIVLSKIYAGVIWSYANFCIWLYGCVRILIKGHLTRVYVQIVFSAYGHMLTSETLIWAYDQNVWSYGIFSIWPYAYLRNFKRSIWPGHNHIAF